MLREDLSSHSKSVLESFVVNTTDRKTGLAAFCGVRRRFQESTRRLYERCTYALLHARQRDPQHLFALPQMGEVTVFS